MNVSLHPAEEDLVFFFKSDYLVCSAKTSSAGPGYHAFTVDLLEDIERKGILKWDWHNEKEGSLDETGYHEHRNFDDLQNSMCGHLRALSNLTSSGHTKEKYRISLPMSLHIDQDFFAATPMGFLEKGFFDEITLLNNSQIHKHAEHFFSWWHPELDALFWRNVGLVQIWTKIKWQPPIEKNDNTHHLLLSTLKCFDHARKIDPDIIGLPLEEIKEIETLLSTNDYYIPKPGKIGFYRNNMLLPLTGKWSISLPGYFYESTEETQDFVKYFHQNQSVSGYSWSGSPDEVPDFPHDEEVEQNKLESFSFENDGLIGQATLINAPETEDSYPVLVCHVAALGSICSVIIEIDDIKDLDWAVSSFKSIRH